MTKSKATYLKVAETAKKKGDKAWAKAKQAEKDGEEGKAANLYRDAKRHYNTAEKAKESALNAE